MSDSASFSLPLDEAGKAGGDSEVKWEEVATTIGLLPATIIAGRLQAAGIPARAWQESAGQAFGLTVGPMGTGHVAVPETHVEEALDLLAEEGEELDWDEEE